ncbi:MAG: hypothetical protein QW562_03980 [Thermosphaera sp.]
MSLIKQEKLAYVSALTALAIILRFFELPFPLLTWLKYDASGVPLAVLAFQGYRLLAYSLPIYYIVSVALGADVVGMGMKVLAEASTIVPLIYLYKKYRSRRMMEIVLPVTGATAGRVVVMHLFNVIVTPLWLVYSYGMSYEAAQSYVYSVILLIDVFNLTIAIPVSLASILVLKRLLKTGTVHG